MTRRLLVVAALLACTSAAAAYLIANSRDGSRFVYESVPASRRPLVFRVDTDPVGGVSSPLTAVQELMNSWNAIPTAEDIFGTPVAGGPYNGATVGSTFGNFTDHNYEIAWDDDGSIESFFGLGGGVLGITLKSVDSGSGDILDLLVIINTQPGALSAPGTGATAEELFRATLIHELGHVGGLGHSPVGMVNTTTFGLSPALPAMVATMFPYRVPVQPQQGVSLEQDDISGFSALYPVAADTVGSLSGHVRGLSGAAINEIAVRVIGPEPASQEHAGSLSDVDGAGNGFWRISSLPPGGYRVLIECVNGRGNVDEMTLAGGTDALGGNPFLHAADEFWQPGDTYDPAVDVVTQSSLVQVRAGRDTGSIDFVLNAAPILQGQTLNGSWGSGDAQVGDSSGGFHYVEYYVFSGSAGQAATVTVTGSGAAPQLLLLRPGYGLEAQDLPLIGATASVSPNLSQSGIFTVAVSARATTGNPGGTGAYTITLQGAGAALPAAPAVTGPSVALGPANPAARSSGSPVCRAGLLQLRLRAPSHEELWVDSLRLRASGSGNDALDVTGVEVVRDTNGNGAADGNEPVLASGTFSSDDGTLQLTGLGLEVDPGATADLVVVYDVSFPATAGLPATLWILPGLLLLLAMRIRPRFRGAALLLLLVALGPSGCGGGGGGNGCNPAFDGTGTVTTYACRVQPGDIVSFTPTGDPATPLTLPATALQSNTLSVSH